MMTGNLYSWMSPKGMGRHEKPGVFSLFVFIIFFCKGPDKHFTLFWATWSLLKLLYTSSMKTTIDDI